MNNKILFCLSLVLSTGIAGQAEAKSPSAVHNYDDQLVGEIEIKVENLAEGSSFDKNTIRAKLKTHQGDVFSQYVFDQDLKQLANDYDRVEPQITVQDGKVDITLKVWLRPVIHKIEWEGNSAVKTRILRRELDTDPGSIFNRADFNKSFNKVKEYYIKKGYFESEISYKLIRDPKTQEVDIIIKVSEGRSGKVDSIVFKGFSKKEESAILNKLYTKKYSSLTSWFTGKGKFVEEALEQDRLTIFNYLQDEGYADARVNIEILESQANGKVVIDISADKGALYRFGQISFNGNILLSDEDVERVFMARPDETYSPDKLRKTAEAIKELYGRKGYIDTSVTYETQLMQDSPIYNIYFNVDEGREYHIGMIRVIGNIQTEARVILRESLLVPGEAFDSLKLKVTQARLENMGYFKSVNVYAVRTQDDLSLGDNYRDIYIEVEETQTGNVSLFGGFSSAENVFGGLDLTERNFNYRGLTKVFSEGGSALRGGGEFLHLRSSFGPKQQSYMASWLTPYFLDSPWRIGFEFTANINSTLISDDYDLNTYNLGGFVAYPLSPYLSYGFKYRVKNYDIVVDRDIANSPENDKKLDRRHERGILSGLGASLTYDSTNSPMSPNRGLRSLIEGEFVGVGGSATFFRTAAINSYYTPLWQYGHMRYRCDFRFLFPMGQTNTFAEIPISERFFLGGVASVRGYKDFILGPRFDKIDRDGESRKGRGDPTGGISSSLLSIEYVQAVLPIMEVFLFMDAGYVTDQQFNFGTYRASYGIGTYLNIMGRMPITLGYGVPVNPANRDQKQKDHFFFSMGGQF